MKKDFAFGEGFAAFKNTGEYFSNDEIALFDRMWEKYRNNISSKSFSDQHPTNNQCQGYYTRPRTDRRARRIEETCILAIKEALALGVLKEEDLSSMRCLDVGVGSPALWGILYEMYGVKNFVGVDLFTEDFFDELVLEKEINFKYYFSDETVHDKLRNDEKFDLIITCIDTYKPEASLVYKPYLKKSGVICYDYNQAVLHMEDEE